MHILSTLDDENPVAGKYNYFMLCPIKMVPYLNWNVATCEKVSDSLNLRTTLASRGQVTSNPPL